MMFEVSRWVPWGGATITGTRMNRAHLFPSMSPLCSSDSVGPESALATGHHLSSRLGIVDLEERLAVSWQNESLWELQMILELISPRQWKFWLELFFYTITPKNNDYRDKLKEIIPYLVMR